MFTQLLREPWKNVVDISPVLSRLETNPQFAQVIAPSDMIAIVTLNMKIGDVEGMLNICLPFFTLEDVMDKLNTNIGSPQCRRTMMNTTKSTLNP